ncbi:MAG TPA: gamma-glutamyltransferase [Thermodesulfobacteriota bacterium]|nr:gamma-glutamyltransferase [Thermodesulfobacteriota bacterium]
MNHFKRGSTALYAALLTAALLTAFISPVTVGPRASDLPGPDREAIFHPVYAQNGMVVSEEKHATEAGLQVLKEGGNAVDAAVTAGFVLAVTFPRAGNLGGGGFMLVRMAETGEVVAIDYREKAPMAVTAGTFLDEDGNVDTEKTRYSVLSAGVPGTVAGLALALEKYGTIPLERAIRPALELAENGFPVSEGLAASLDDARPRMEKEPGSIRVFFKEGGEPYAPGDVLVQKDLAETLRLISEHGPGAFYEGEIAVKIARFMKERGGLITEKDLKEYSAAPREPVRGTYRGYKIYSMPPPSSGGVHLIEMLNILEGFPLGEYGHNTARTINLMAEAMKFAYADRSEHLGDPDFKKVPVAELTSKKYAEKLRKKMSPGRVTPSVLVKPGEMPHGEGRNTTHFSVVDSKGNMVSNTYTLNFDYGSKIIVPGTGILLNNEMDDFSMKPGEPNAYGLLGGQANSPEPGKRMLSSMTPTLVLKDGEPFLATGSPGGSLIITTVLQIITNVIDFGMNISEATNAPRVHHQWLPDKLRIEKGISGDTLRLLTERGYTIDTGNTMGSAQSIMKKGEFLYGASDPRRPGGLAEGY